MERIARLRDSVAAWHSPLRDAALRVAAAAERMIEGRAVPDDQSVIAASPLLSAAVGSLNFSEQLARWSEHISPAVTASPLELGFVSLARRDDLLRLLYPRFRPSAVLVPLYCEPGGEYAFLMSRRASVNPWTGRPMEFGGEDVLFGGSVDPGESALEAALREFLEEMTPREQDSFPAPLAPVPTPRPLLWLGRWLVESGYQVDGFAALLDPSVNPASLGYNRGEVESIVSVPLRELFSKWSTDIRRRVVADATGKTLLAGEFETPYMVAMDQLTGREVEVWGVAGYMTSRLADLCRRNPGFLSHSARQSRTFVQHECAGNSSAQESRSRIFHAAHEARRFLREVLRIAPPSFVEAPRLSSLLHERAILQLEPTLALGYSGKIRSVGAIARRAAETVLSGEGAGLDQRIASRGEEPGQARWLKALAEAFDQRTLVAASTGSHARAVHAIARWLRQNAGSDVQTRVFVTSDISDSKQLALEDCFQIVPDADFNQATRVALDECARHCAAGQRWSFIPTDPIGVSAPDGLFHWSDGMEGFATTAADALDWIAHQHRLGVFDEPRVDRLVLPTSGGATWAACLAYCDELRACGQRTDSEIGHVLAIGQRGGNPVYSSLAAGRLVTVDPFQSGRIPGLAQSEMSPFAFDLIRDLVPDPALLVGGASLSFVKLAQLLILADTGLLPEPAGAAAVGWALERSSEQARFAENVREAWQGSGLEMTDLRRVDWNGADEVAVGLNISELAGLRGLERSPRFVDHEQRPRSSIYIVSGAWEKQSARILSRRLEELDTQSDLPIEDSELALLGVLPAMVPLLDETERASLRRGDHVPVANAISRFRRAEEARVRLAFGRPTELRYERLLEACDEINPGER